MIKNFNFQNFSFHVYYIENYSSVIREVLVSLAVVPFACYASGPGSTPAMVTFLFFFYKIF